MSYAPPPTKKKKINVIKAPPTSKSSTAFSFAFLALPAHTTRLSHARLSRLSRLSLSLSLSAHTIRLSHTWLSREARFYSTRLSRHANSRILFYYCKTHLSRQRSPKTRRTWKQMMIFRYQDKEKM